MSKMASSLDTYTVIVLPSEEPDLGKISYSESSSGEDYSSQSSEIPLNTNNNAGSRSRSSTPESNRDGRATSLSPTSAKSHRSPRSSAKSARSSAKSARSSAKSTARSPTLSPSPPRSPLVNDVCRGKSAGSRKSRCGTASTRKSSASPTRSGADHTPRSSARSTREERRREAEIARKLSESPYSPSVSPGPPRSRSTSATGARSPSTISPSRVQSGKSDGAHSAKSGSDRVKSARSSVTSESHRSRRDDSERKAADVTSSSIKEKKKTKKQKKEDAMVEEIISGIKTPKLKTARFQEPEPEREPSKWVPSPRSSTPERKEPKKNGNGELKIILKSKKKRNSSNERAKTAPKQKSIFSPRSTRTESQERQRAFTATPSSDKPSRASSSPRRPASQGDGKRKEFFKEELNRLVKSLKCQSEKIVKPPIKEHIPYVFNTLEPYYNVSNAKQLIRVPQEFRQGYISRETAISLCDPWEDHRMDLVTYLPRVDSAKAVINTEQTKKLTDRNRGRSTKGEKQERPPKEGSTRLPKFPAVRIHADDLSRKTLYYSDVPALRNELKKKYSSSASEKVRSDYMRTKQDFFRMELDRLDTYHPSSRPKMKSTYFAYLQNTPGSRRAVTECLETLEAEQGAVPVTTSARGDGTNSPRKTQKQQTAATAS